VISSCMGIGLFRGIEDIFAFSLAHSSFSFSRHSIIGGKGGKGGDYDYGKGGKGDDYDYGKGKGKGKGGKGGDDDNDMRGDDSYRI
jgi:hypothetical protein